jgi:hypothetical protein
MEKRSSISFMDLSDGPDDSEAEEGSFAREKTVLKCKSCGETFYAIYSINHPCFKPREAKSEDKAFSKNAKKKKKKQNTPINLEKHCGVLNESTGEMCRKNISCKLHTIEQKKGVPGRLYPLEILLKMKQDERRKDKVISVEDTSEEITPLDDAIRCKILGIKPVVTKMWHNPEYKYDFLAMRSLFYNPIKHIINRHNKRGSDGNRQGFGRNPGKNRDMDKSSHATPRF